MKSFVLAAALLTVAASPASADTFTFSNNSTINVVDGGETTSSIAVSGITGPLSNLSVTLNLLSHTYPDDLVFGLLNEDLGLGFVFMSGAGGSTDIGNVTLKFSDAAAIMLPQSFAGGPITSGTYLPSNYGNYAFTFFDNATNFADFDGFSPNGTWTLFIDDVFPADGGSLASGWSVSFDAAAAPSVPEPTTWAMMIGGFAFAGAAMRRRARTVAFAA